MKQYDVTITARVTKTLRVEADNEQDACEFAHQEFTVASSDLPERYNEDTDCVREVETA